MKEFSHEHIKSVLDYCGDTGVFTWRPRPISSFATPRAGRIFNSRFAGHPAGSINGSGYRFIQIEGKSVRAHRLVFFYLYGSWPPDAVDHINGDRSDNRVSNLRLADSVMNNRNFGLSVKNTSGFTGVTWHKKKNKWIAQSRCGSKNIQIGSFSSFDDAVMARKSYNYENNFHENHGERPSLKRAGL